MAHSILHKALTGLLIGGMILSATILRAQNSTGGTSITLRKAGLCYNTRNYAQAIIYFEQHFANGNNDDRKALSELADSYWNMRLYPQALKTYKQLYPTDISNATKKEKIRIAELFARTGDYQSASECIGTVEGYEKKAAFYRSKNSIANMKKDSMMWRSGRLNINTKYREFSPVVVDSSLLFCSNRPEFVKTVSSGWDGYNYLRLWEVSTDKIDTLKNIITSDKIQIDKSDGKPIKNIADIYECGDNKSTASLNKLLITKKYLAPGLTGMSHLLTGLEKMNLNIGSVAVDNKKRIYFSSNYDKGDKNKIYRVRLMEGVYKNGHVKSIKPLPFGDANAFSVMHPAVNADGTIIVFACDKFPNEGFDLYYAQRTGISGEWSQMKPLAANINTAGNEVFPVITKGNNLYFSSDARPGLGGLDIYKIALSDAIAGKGEALQLSYPINTGADDFGFAPSDSLEKNGYFCSDRYENDDLYYFSYIELLNGKYTSKGRVVDAVSGKPLKDATVFCYNTQTAKVLVLKTNDLGEYVHPLSESGTYIVKAVEKKHSDDCFSYNIALKPLKKDTIISSPDLSLDLFDEFKWRLNNIHYDFDKWNIRADAQPILDSVVAILKSYPCKIELSSHTDSRGSIAYNDRLSQRRAESAVAYLIRKGIEPDRITAKGYGERQLFNKCADGVKCTEVEHQQNRRTEVKIIAISKERKPMEVDPDQYTDGQEINVSELPEKFFENCNK